MAKSKSARKRGRTRTRGASRPSPPRAASGSPRAASAPSARVVRPTTTGTKRAGPGEDRPARYRETSARDWRHSLTYIAIFLGSVVVAFTIVAPRRGPALAVLLVLLTLWTLVGWHNRAFAYRCANCRRVFQVPTVVNFLTFQGVSRQPDGTYRGWKLLTCPNCHKRTKATVVRKVETPPRTKRASPGSDARLLQ